MEIFIEKFFEIVTNQWVLIILASFGFTIYMLKDGLNKFIANIGKKPKKKEENTEITVETFLNHDLFSELQLQKHLLSPNFTTHGKTDINKNRVFSVFVEEKMDSVAWSMRKMLTEYKSDMTKDQLKTHVYKAFLECDDNLECKLSDRLLKLGVPHADIDNIIRKFVDIRQDTLKNYTNRIDKMFSFSSQYNISKKYLILTLFEILSFEIRGMIIDINATFEDVNGDFLELVLTHP